MAEVEDAESFTLDGRAIERKMVGTERDRGNGIYTFRKSIATPRAFSMRVSKYNSTKKKQVGRETLVLNEMCVERGRKLRDPFKFNVTTKLENV